MSMSPPAGGTEVNAPLKLMNNYWKFDIKQCTRILLVLHVLIQNCITSLNTNSDNSIAYSKN